MPVGVDLAETAMFFELEKAGMKVVDGQQVMLDAREIKNIDEIVLLNQAAAMVDGTYHMIYEELKPGVRENDIVAKANEMLYRLGSDDVEAINAISGERCNPHPHNFTDRLFRPGDQAFFDILQSFIGYRTCYYRTFNIGRATPVQRDAYKKCREWLDRAIELIKPGVSTDRVASVWPKAEDFGFPSEMAAFGLQFGHGLGLALHERPIISRLVSLDTSDGDQDGHGLRARDLLPGGGRLFGGADRGGGRGHRQGLPGHHALPRRGPAHRQRLLTRRQKRGVDCMATRKPPTETSRHKFNPGNVKSDRTLREDRGWLKMDVRWVITEKNANSEHTVVGRTILPPGVGSMHALHRHPHAEEWEYVIHGTGIKHVGDDSFYVRPGDIAFIPKECLSRARERFR